MKSRKVGTEMIQEYNTMLRELTAKHELNMARGAWWAQYEFLADYAHARRELADKHGVIDSFDWDEEEDYGARLVNLSV